MSPVAPASTPERAVTAPLADGDGDHPCLIRRAQCLFPVHNINETHHVPTKLHPVALRWEHSLHDSALAMMQRTSTQNPAILPLPAHVAAQIKSSTAIVSLSGVVLDLFKNALDADATRLEATVDFARGACTVQDDGLGIPPLEFREEGGLGKLHWTSKHENSRNLFGRHGTFLASLSAVSLLSIVSRHHQHRSHNAVTLHHAKVVERQLPASSQQDITGKHGTRVVVRNLFGNLPVRVKQRSKVAAQKVEYDRLWHSLKALAVGLLLGWARPVSVKVRDAHNRIVFAINTSELRHASQGREASSWKPPSGQLASMLNILTQASYLSVAQWPYWVPISASTSELHIKGAISLDPSPTKTIQFISLGSHPLPSDREHNELYDEVNRLFHLSNFGTDEGDALDGPANNNIPSKTRSREVGNTKDHTISRKVVDKYPMFHLRISLREGLTSTTFGQQFIDNETNVQSVIEILQAMIVQWLSANHFCPKWPHERKTSLLYSSTGQSRQTAMPGSSRSVTQFRLPASDSASSSSPRTSTNATSDVTIATTRKRKLDSMAAVTKTSRLCHSRAFADWSRIKSSNTNSFTSTLLEPKPGLAEDSLPGRNLVDTKTDALPPEPKFFASGRLTTEPLARGALNARPSDGGEHALATTNVELDDAILWADPSAKRRHSINARTGFFQPIMSHRPSADPVTSLHSTRRKSVERPLRFPSRTAAPAKTPWLDTVIKNWDNPIFRPHERSIEQVDLHGNYHNGDSIQDRHLKCAHSNGITSHEHSVKTERLCSESLLTARVLAQVDRKFILIKASRSIECSAKHPPETSKDLLVLIDQHAADERIQVESLLRELCSPVDGTESHYRSKLGHSAEVASVLLEKPVRFSISRQEGIHFTTFAGNFASWGILFDVLDSDINFDERSASLQTSCLLIVSALPPSVSERCKADTALLISFLRSTVWDYASNAAARSGAPFAHEGGSSSWVSRLASCPKGLIDMINSRACRSAIMFNDELRLQECQKLVQRLAGCVFPFVCAHGRPSLVPLADVESLAHGCQAVDIEWKVKSGGFVQAWKQWKT